MGTYVVIQPDGTVSKVPGGAKFDIQKAYELIGCRTVERTDVQYEGRARDCWLDEEGLLCHQPQWNPHVRQLSVEYWGKRGVPAASIQSFAGVGVIWLPKGA